MGPMAPLLLSGSLLRLPARFARQGLRGLQQSWRCYSGQAPRDDRDLKSYEPLHRPPTSIVRKRGVHLLNDPWFNKGSAFPYPERDRLGIRGLVPPVQLTLETQTARIMEDYWTGQETVPPEDVKTGGVTNEMARRWGVLQELQDRNETLFYRVLLDNFREMAPIVYTPTVGWVCTNHHRLYRNSRGMYFSAADRGEMAAMVWNWPADHVSAIVVTDGSRILGLGDLGINGLGIPIGKLDLYCAAAGFSPSNVLPVVIDVGTNNERLLKDKFYMGLRHKRITGKEYYAIMDEFVQAVMSRWPGAVLQFEDFAQPHALTLLNRYRDHHLVFNDDIQGTAAAALAGMYGAMRVLGKPAKALTEQRIVCVGAGSAGMGVCAMMAKAMETRHGLSWEEAHGRFWVLDHEGLITSKRRDRLPDHVLPFARANAKHEGERLLDIIRRVKPTVLLGLAGAGRLFTEEVLRTMNAECKEQRPVVFAMSNPTSKLECTSEEAVKATNGRIVYASGSPQPNVSFQGRTYHASQANNMYLFPGMALGAWLSSSRTMTDSMIMRAAVTLPQLISDEDLAKGIVYPRLDDIRKISATIALEVIKQAAEEGRARGPARAKLAAGEPALQDWIEGQMFEPEYTSLVELPVGVEQ